MKLEKTILNNREVWMGPDNCFYSMIPPYENFCFRYFLPDTFQYTILQLGSCGNSFRYLLKEKYPDTILTDVDIEDYSECSDNFIQADAFEFVKNTSNFYDYSIVDLANTTNVCEEIYDEDFQKHLKRISKKGVINCGTYNEDFVHLKCTKKIKAEENNLYFWEN
jgi:hypothetical protein